MKTIELFGLTVEYTVADAGYEGDADVPGGLNYLGEYVDYLAVKTPTKDDITDWLSDDAIDQIEDEILGV